MLISIIIPIYNVEQYIEECLESVYQQTYPNIEVILVNDCTPDSSMTIAYSIVAKYKDKYLTTIINHEVNKGISEARNSGMKVAKGEYIYFIDSDDAIMPKAIEVLANIASQNKDIEIVEGQHITGTSFHLSTSLQDTNQVNIYKDEDCIKQCLRSPYIWNILIKRTFIHNLNLFFDKNITYGEDQIFRYSLAKHLSSIAITSHVTYFYRIRQFSICHNIEKKHFDNLVQLQHFIINNIYSNKVIKEVQIYRFCAASSNYYSKRWKKTIYHRNYYFSFQSNIKLFIKNNFKDINIYNHLLLSPFYFPYPIAIYYSKIIWKIRSLVKK